MSGTYEAPALTVLGQIADLTHGVPCGIFPAPGGGFIGKTIGATDHVFHIHGQDVPLSTCSL